MCESPPHKMISKAPDQRGNRDEIGGDFANTWALSLLPSKATKPALPSETASHLGTEDDKAFSHLHMADDLNDHEVKQRRFVEIDGTLCLDDINASGRPSICGRWKPTPRYRAWRHIREIVISGAEYHGSMEVRQET